MIVNLFIINQKLGSIFFSLSTVLPLNRLLIACIPFHELRMRALAADVGTSNSAGVDRSVSETNSGVS